MGESIISRVRRLMSGSLEDLVDKMESSSSETVMREAIREVDRAVDEAKAAQGNALAKRHHANRHVAMAEQKLAELAGKAKLAISEHRDDLAEAVIARQLDLEAQIPVLAASAKDAGTEADELGQCVLALEGRKREMERDLASYQASVQQAQTVGSANAGTTSQATRRTELAEQAFTRAMQSATGLEGLGKIDRSVAAKLSELDTVERQNVIASRLAAMKQQRSAA